MKYERYKGDGKGGNDDFFPYLANRDLVRAVNMAITLKRPLLVKGPPGCGKTQLASSIAHELKVNLFQWYVKSTSKARDGLYTIDMIRRLQDAQMRRDEAKSLCPYISLGLLGKAIEANEESVVLIDEIDKADYDFPNDLLREVEHCKFDIPELTDHDFNYHQNNNIKRAYQTDNPPIIVITSNQEKELPEAFLRRCLFHHIDFPDEKHLYKIVIANISEISLEDTLVKQAIDRICLIRNLEDFQKPPSTSELIDWIRILHLRGCKLDHFTKARRLTDLPHWEILFKHHEDILLAKKTISQEEIR